MAPRARDYGLTYLVVTVIHGGVLQVLLAFAGAARLMRFVPHSVMVGFVKDRALLILVAQLPHLSDVPWMVYPMVALAAVRIIVAYSTFDWHSLKSLPPTPERETT